MADPEVVLKLLDGGSESSRRLKSAIVVMQLASFSEYKVARYRDPTATKRQHHRCRSAQMRQCACTVAEAIRRRADSFEHR
jgi:hypothetical protein